MRILGDFKIWLPVNAQVVGVLGLDYKIKGAPINLSIDWQPYFEIAKYPHFGNWGGFAIRYTF